MTGYTQMVKPSLAILVCIILLLPSLRCLKSDSISDDNTVTTITQNTIAEGSKLIHSRKKRQSMMLIQRPIGTVPGSPRQVEHRHMQPATNQHHPVIRKSLVPPPQIQHQQQQYFSQQQQHPLRQLPEHRFQPPAPQQHQHHNQLQFPSQQPQLFAKSLAQERVRTVRQQAVPPISILRHPVETSQVAVTTDNAESNIPDIINSQVTDKSKLGFLHHSSVTHETRTTSDSTVHKTESKQLTIAHPDTSSLGDLLGSVNLTVNPADLQALKDRYNSEDTTLDNDIVVAYGGYNSYARRAKEVDPKGNRLESLDMRLTKEQYKLFHESSREKRKAIRPNSYLWTNGIIPYTIETSFPSQDVEKIHMSMSVWERETCIRFRKASSRDRNYVVIKNGQGCSSHVGMIGGAQELTLHPNCRKKQQIIVHELGHAIGMIHEHQRPDRNDYVVIKQDKAMDNTAADFRMYSWNVINSHSVQYDYQSIMHYGGTAFARASNAITIETIDPFYQDYIGKATTISQSDVTTVQRMYNCEVKQTRQNFLSTLFPSSNFGINFNHRNPVNLIRVERPRFNRRVVRPTVINRLPGSVVQSRQNNRVNRRRIPTHSNWINNIVAPFFQNGLNSPRTRF